MDAEKVGIVITVVLRSADDSTLVLNTVETAGSTKVVLDCVIVSRVVRVATGTTHSTVPDCCVLIASRLPEPPSIKILEQL